MKNYIQLAKEKGIHHALFELERDVICQFAGFTKAETARTLKVGRSGLCFRIEKLNLSHLFTQEARELKMKGDSQNGYQKENQENHQEEI
jgi:hypothetical protein